jgi:hypothetical protein
MLLQVFGTCVPKDLLSQAPLHRRGNQPWQLRLVDVFEQ